MDMAGTHLLALAQSSRNSQATAATTNTTTWKDIPYGGIQSTYSII
jgi:hypothetical protein